MAAAFAISAAIESAGTFQTVVRNYIFHKFYDPPPSAARSATHHIPRSRGLLCDSLLKIVCVKSPVAALCTGYGGLALWAPSLVLARCADGGEAVFRERIRRRAV